MSSKKKGIQAACRLPAVLVFVVVFLINMDFTADLSSDMMVTAAVKAVFSGLLFWLFALVIADILVKGVIQDIDDSRIDPLEGGIEQRIYERKTAQDVKVNDIELKQKKK
ncbi:MAG: hypothetical protein ACQEQV_05935 [Fibrobacterota bacterium]